MTARRPSTLNQVITHLIGALMCFFLGALWQYDHAEVVASRLCSSQGYKLERYDGFSADVSVRCVPHAPTTTTSTTTKAVPVP